MKSKKVRSYIIAGLSIGIDWPANVARGEGLNLHLPEIVVTATRAERDVFETPQAINVITDRDVVESNAGITPDILVGQEGILIQKSNTGGGSPFIRA